MIFFTGIWASVEMDVTVIGPELNQYKTQGYYRKRSIPQKWVTQEITNYLNNFNTVSWVSRDALAKFEVDWRNGCKEKQIKQTDIQTEIPLFICKVSVIEATGGFLVVNQELNMKTDAFKALLRMYLNLFGVTEQCENSVKVKHMLWGEFLPHNLYHS